MEFYKRNYIEGLFLSSGVCKNPDYACEMMIKTLRLLRENYNFCGYIHAKAIPGADEKLLTALGYLADRMSVNIELPTQESLRLLAPQKNKDNIIKPMRRIERGIEENRTDIARYKSAPRFVPAGQSTQMIVGATPESDYQILNLAAGLYKNYKLKRVFFSAYLPMVADKNLPALNTDPPLSREHRLYQADWLLRFYKFDVSEIIDIKNPFLNPFIDPKCNWALNHMECFPVEVNSAPYDRLLRVPGIGVKSARLIVSARRTGKITFEGLKKLGVVMKRAQFFISCGGKVCDGIKVNPGFAFRALVSDGQMTYIQNSSQIQLSLFEQEEREALYNKCKLLKEI